METKTKIILTRRSEWLNRLRSYKIFIDDAEAGTIKNGASEEFLISPGIHSIQCKIAWYSSPVFVVNIEKGSIEYLMVRNGIRYYWLTFVLLITGLIINLIYTGTHNERPFEIFVLQLALLVPSLFYMLYYLTVGRKQYLLIEEDSNNVFAS